MHEPFALPAQQIRADERHHHGRLANDARDDIRHDAAIQHVDDVRIQGADELADSPSEAAVDMPAMFMSRHVHELDGDTGGANPRPGRPRTFPHSATRALDTRSSRGSHAARAGPSRGGLPQGSSPTRSDYASVLRK